MSKVYTFGPTFRAENSNTSRHLAEFWMVEPEVAFADLADNAALAERLLKSVTQRVLNDCENDLGFFQQRIDNTVLERLTNIVDQPFVRVTYSDAIDILLKSGKKFEFPVEWGIDMASEHERFLSETHFKAPVVVTDYPRDIKAFYMRLNDDERTVAAMDVLAPGIGEIIGGSQREERLDVLDARMDEALKIPCGGTAIFGATARCRTPVLAWASNVWLPTSREWRMCETLFHSPEPRQCRVLMALHKGSP